MVNHIDGDKKNNDISNLEWVTRKENAEHAAASGLLSDRSNLVRIISFVTGEETLYNSVSELVREHKEFNRMVVNAILRDNDKDRVYKGYHFRRVDGCNNYGNNS
jgi:hypothetical protein